MQNSLQIWPYAISRTAEETLCCATSSRLPKLFLLIYESLRLINSYLNNCCALYRQWKRKGCAACTAVKQGDGRAGSPRDALFWLWAATCRSRTDPSHLQLIPSELRLFPGIFQIPPSTSSLLPHLDNQQSICCSHYPWRNKFAGTWVRRLTHG